MSRSPLTRWGVVPVAGETVRFIALALVFLLASLALVGGSQAEASAKAGLSRVTSHAELTRTSAVLWTLDKTGYVDRHGKRQGDLLRQPSVWDGLRHRLLLGGDAFVERQCARSNPPERLPAGPRAQHRPLAKPLADFAGRYPDRREAIARAFRTGVYSRQETADDFGAHCSTVSRAVRRLKAEETRAPG